MEPAMRLVSPPHLIVAQARRTVADPELCARNPGRAHHAWLVLKSAAGRIPRQTHRPALPRPTPTGGDAA
jgi:hypothetical protein